MADQQHNVSVSITGDVRGVQKALALFSGDLRKTEAQARGTAQRMQRIRLQAARDVASRGAGLLRGAAALGGGLGIAAAFQDARNFEKQLTDLAVASGNLSNKFVSKLRGQVTDLSNKFGIGASQIAGYAQEVVGITGNTQLATGTMNEMAKVAFATGSNMGDLAGIVANLSGKLGLSQQQFGQAFEVLATQADKGSFELRDMAKEMNTVLVAASQLGVKGIKGVRVVGALAQVARRAAGSSAEAGTALSRFFQQLVAKRSSIEKTFGVSLKDGAGNFKDMSVILGELVGRFKQLQAEGKKFKGGKDIAAKSLELFDVRGGRVFQQLVRDFATAGGGQLSFQALAGIKGTGDTLGAKAKFRRKSPAVQFDIELNKMRNAMRKHLLPVLKEASKWMPLVGKALKFILENSKLLLSLWLGVKGALFFRRLMAPVAGGAGVSGALGAGAAAGGMVFTPGGQVAGRTAQPMTRGQKFLRGAAGAASVAAFAPLMHQVSRTIGDKIFGSAEATGKAFAKELKVFQQEEAKRRARAALAGAAVRGRSKNVGAGDALLKSKRGGGILSKAAGAALAAFGADEGLFAQQAGQFQQFDDATMKMLMAHRARAAIGTTARGVRTLAATRNVGQMRTLQSVVGDKVSRKSIEAAQQRFGAFRQQFVAAAQEFLGGKQGAGLRAAGVTAEQIASQLPEVVKIDAILENLKANAVAVEKVAAGEKAPIKLFITMGRDTPGSRTTVNAGNDRKVVVQQL